MRDGPRCNTWSRCIFKFSELIWFFAVLRSVEGREYLQHSYQVKKSYWLHNWKDLPKLKTYLQHGHPEAEKDKMRKSLSESFHIQFFIWIYPCTDIFSYPIIHMDFSIPIHTLENCVYSNQVEQVHMNKIWCDDVVANHQQEWSEGGEGWFSNELLAEGWLIKKYNKKGGFLFLFTFATHFLCQRSPAQNQTIAW